MNAASEIDILAHLLDDQSDPTVLQDPALWQVIQSSAGRFGVAPLVAYIARSHLSLAERKWCDRILIDSWTRHDRMLRELDFLASLFDTDRIPFIALKGPMLARRYYDPPFLRKPAMDLDLAVASADVERACHALARIGYKQHRSIAEAKATSHHIVLGHPSRPSVELHFRLSHMALGVPVEEFLERAVIATLPSGREIRVLAAADQLLHLVLHLAQSRFGTLFHLVEIRRVCKAEPARVREEAVRRACAMHFCGVLRMMDVAFRLRWNEPFLPPGAVVPKAWLDWRLTPALYRNLERWSHPGAKLNLAARLYGRWLDLQMTDRPVEAARWLLLFLKTARFRVSKGRSWGTEKNLRYVASSMAQDDFSPTRRDR